MAQGAAGLTILSNVVTGSVGITNVVTVTGTTTSSISNTTSNPVPVSLIQSPLEVTLGPTYQSQSLARDAFGRLRVSEPVTLFDSKQVEDHQFLFWSEEKVGQSDIVWNQIRASTIFYVSASQVAHAYRQTKSATNYQPGKSLLVLQTFVPGAPAPGITRRMGRFDPHNGIFLQHTGSFVGLCKRSDIGGTPDTQFISQSQWNIDRMDGTGQSGVTLDWTKSQIWWHDIEWLGVGAVRSGFVVDGEFYLAHIMKHTNISGSAYMSTPNLPLRYELINDGTGGAATLEQICATVISEGGLQPKGTVVCASTSNSFCNANATGTRYVVLAIRQVDGHTSSSIEFLKSNIMVSTLNDTYEYSVVLNPTIGGSLTWLPVSGSSAIEKANGDTANTAINGDICFQCGFAFGQSSQTNEIISTVGLGAKLDGTRDILALCVRPVGSSINLDAFGTITVRELQ